MIHACRRAYSITYSIHERLSPVYVDTFKHLNLNIKLKAKHILDIKMENKQKESKANKHSSPHTLAASSETPAVQACWPQPPHGGLVRVPWGSPPHHQGHLTSLTNLNLIWQRTAVSKTLVTYTVVKTSYQEKRAALPTLPLHKVLQPVPSDTRLTPDEPKSLELTQPGEEKATATPSPKSMRPLFQSCLNFKLPYSNPQTEHFSGKKKQLDRSPTKNQ